MRSIRCNPEFIQAADRKELKRKLATTGLNRLIQLGLVWPEAWNRIGSLDESLLSQFDLTEAEYKALNTCGPEDMHAAGVHPTLSIYLTYMRNPQFAQAMSATRYLDNSLL